MHLGLDSMPRVDIVDWKVFCLALTIECQRWPSYRLQTGRWNSASRPECKFVPHCQLEQRHPQRRMNSGIREIWSDQCPRYDLGQWHERCCTGDWANHSPTLDRCPCVDLDANRLGSSFWDGRRGGERKSHTAVVPSWTRTGTSRERRTLRLML